jgi:triosephosphate isomerase
MKKEFLIAGNWKMHKTVEESIDFVSELDKKISNKFNSASKKVEILVIPPFTSLYSLKDISKNIKLAAQNIFFEEKGAYTGEISPLMLKDLSDYVLIGHSERREIFNEKNTDTNKKIKIALKQGFTPILCVGETLKEREKNLTFTKIEKQLSDAFIGLSEDDISKVVIAYEPIWAIGTGKNATPQEAQVIHFWIRNFLCKKTKKAEGIKILYGGSVKPDNSYNILSQNDINGVLVGGASLKIDSFFAIIENSYKLLDL